MESQYHIMMFPWLAFGHMIPFLELSKSLASKGITISYVSTPKNLQRLPLIPSNLSPKINLIEIPLPSVPGLPNNCEATTDLDKPQIPFLKQAYDKLSEHFKPLLNKIVPDLILIDFASYWIKDIASERGIPIAFFSVYTASTLTYLGSPTDLKPVMQRPSPDHGQKMMSRTNIPDTSGVSSGQRLAKVIEDSSFVVVRSCHEFEGEYVSVIEEKYNKLVLPIGVLPPLLEDKIVEQKVDRSNILKWLDGQKSKSVVFVGFGSEYKMPVEEIRELAYSLELCKLPFLWVIRNATGKDSDLLLPDGFLGSVQDQGIVTFDWVPQQEILAHPSIGGCLFHSGWGTIVESLGFGHPLILLPMVSDQGLNAKLLVEKGLGYEVPRNEGGFSRPEADRWTRNEVPRNDGVKSEDFVAVEKVNRGNPFGAARPREEVLAEKGLDWKKLDLEVEEKKSGSGSRPGSAHSNKSETGGEGVVVKERKKVNPFGEAKPREVLLEEKGLDWKKIDLELEHKKIDRPETEEEKNLKQEIENLNKELLEKLGDEKTSVQELIHKMEQELDLLVRELDEKVRYTQKTYERPGSGSGRPPSQPGSYEDPRAGFQDRPPSRPGSYEDSRAGYQDRPRSRPGAYEESRVGYQDRPLSRPGAYEDPRFNYHDRPRSRPGAYEEPRGGFPQRSFSMGGGYQVDQRGSGGYQADPRAGDYNERPRSRGTVNSWTRPGDDRSGVQGGGGGRGFFGSREVDRSGSRW